MNPLKRLSVSLLILVSGLTPRSPGQLSTQRGTSEVAGVVVSVHTGQPLASARISMRLVSKGKPFAVTNRTGPNGRFHFKNVPAGRHAVIAAKPGYLSRPSSRREVAVEESELTDGVSVPLWKAAAITGAVTDPNGEPVPRVEVHALDRRSQSGREALVSRARAATDDRGIFRLHGLESGAYVVAALPPQITSLRGQARFRAALYFPSTRRAVEAAPVNLAWGEERTAVDFEWEDRSRLVASGVAKMTDGGPCDSCEMAVIPSGEVLVEEQLLRFTSREDGRFLIEHLEPGSYLTLVQSGTETGEAFGRGELSIVDQSIRGLEVVVHPSRNVVGTIILDDPPTGVELEGTTVRLTPDDPPVFWPERGGGVGKDGVAFRIGGVPAGSYDLTLQPLPIGGYLKELAVAGRRLAEPRLAVTDAGDTTGIEVVVAFDGGSVSGQVETGDEESRCRAGLIPADQGPSYRRQRWEECDASGDFRFDAVTPGTYYAVAVAEDVGPELSDSVRLAAMRRSGRRVDVEPRGRVQLELKLLR